MAGFEVSIEVQGTFKKEVTYPREGPAAEAAEVTNILRSFGLTAQESAPIVAALNGESLPLISAPVARRPA